MNIVNSNLRINMTGTERQPQAAAARYRAALEMAAYADAHGFASVNVEEHHCAENGWLPSPLTMAAAIAARTQQGLCLRATGGLFSTVPGRETGAGLERTRRVFPL